MENWKKVIGFDNYSVSDQGRIRRDAPSRSHPLGGHILTPASGVKGHNYVNLYRGNRGHSVYVHRVVLEAFVGPPPDNKPVAAHGNGNPSDNRLANLRWASAKENSADSILHGTSPRPSGVNHFRAKLTPEKIDEARIRMEAGESMRSIARAFGVTHATISSALSGRSYKHETCKRSDSPLHRD